MKTFLNNAKKVAQKKPILNVLNYALFTETDITVSNLTAQYTFKHGLNVQGSGLVPFYKFADAYTKLKDIDEVIINDAQAIIKRGKTTLKLNVGDDEFPLKDISNPTSSGMVDFDDKFVKAQKFVGKDELRPMITGVNFNPKKIVSTDAHKMYFTDHNDFIQEEFTLPKDAFFIRGGFDYIKDAEYVKFENKNETLVVRFIEGAYPNYDAVIPKDNPNKFSIDKKELLSAIDTLSVAYNETTKLIIFSHNNIYAEDIDMGSSCSVDVDMFDIKEGVIRFGFNASHLKDIISTIDDNVITIEGSSPSRKFIINNEYLLIPLYL